MRPIVSVIIPTYNRAHLIGRAIQSVLDQTYQNFELIIVDDGSQDNTEKVVKEFNNPRIRYLRQNVNKGASAARNTGIKNAEGKYVAFLDSDDEWLPEKLEKQIEVFKNLSGKYGVIYSAGWLVKNNIKKIIPLRVRRSKSGDIKKLILKKGLIWLQSAVIKKSCFEQVGLFDEKLFCIEDWELWIRISKHYCFYFLREPLWNYYIASDNVSLNKKALLPNLIYIFKKHYRYIHQYPSIESRYWYLIGNLYCEVGNIKEGRNHFSQALRINPLELEAIIGWGISFLGSEIYNKFQKVREKFILGIS